MASTQVAVLYRHIQGLFGPREAAAFTDGRLLEAFVAGQDESAFAALVQRHGSMVMGVCRRVLHDAHDAEDAFQATFLILARKAGAIRQCESVAGWLYSVAYRVAGQARGTLLRRQLRESTTFPCSDTLEHPEGGPMHADPNAEVSRRELRALLDDELHHLPEKYRAPLVLCYLEGKSHTEAAAELCWAVGTLKSRVARGCDLLRGRLTRRGVALSLGALSLHLAEAATSGAVPAAILRETARAAAGFSAGNLPSGIASARVLALAEGALKTMSLSPVKLFAMALLTLGLVGTGTSLLLYPAAAQESPRAKPAAEKPPEAAPAPRADAHGDAMPSGVLIRFGTVRWRHGENISRVTFGPGDKTIVSASSDGTVRVWDRATGKEIRRLAIPTGGTISPDGTLLATQDTKNFIHLWDLTTGKELRDFKGPPGVSNARMVFSRDGKMLACAGFDQSIQFHETATGKEVSRIPGKAPEEDPKKKSMAFRGGITDLCFSPNGKRIAVSVQDVDKDENVLSAVKLYDTANGKELSCIETSRFGSNGLNFSPDGKLLAYAGGEKIRLVDPETGKEVRSFPGVAFGARGLIFTPDGKNILVADSHNRTIQLLDARSGDVIREIGKEHALGSNTTYVIYLANGGTGDVALSADGKILARGGEGHTIRFWEVETGNELPQMVGHLATVAAISVGPDGKELLTWGEDGVVRRWDANTGKETRRFFAGNGTLSVVFAPDGRTFAIARDNKTIRRVEVSTGNQLNTIEVPGGVSAMAYAPDGKSLAVRGSDGFLYLLDVASGKELQKIAIPADEEPGNDNLANLFFRVGEQHLVLAFSPDGKYVATQAAKNTLRLWETATGLEARQVSLRGNINSFVFAPDSRTLAVENGDRTVSIYEFASGKERCRFGKAKDPSEDTIEARDGVVFYTALRVGSKSASPTVAYSPDGRTLATRTAGIGISLWDVPTGKELHQLQGHQGEISALAFGPTGQTLVSGSHDTTALLWDVAGARPEPVTAAEELSPEKWEAFWSDLKAEDATRAIQAMNALVGVPRQTVVLLGKRLQVTPAPEAGAVESLIAGLLGPKFEVRQRSRDELVKLGYLARPGLAKVLEGQPSLETSQRIEGVLRDIVSGPLSGELLQQVRALEVLERIGTPEARAILGRLAKGAAGARQTVEAQATLERLGK